MLGKARIPREEAIVYQSPGGSGATIYMAPNFGAAGAPAQMLYGGNIGTTDVGLGMVGRSGSVFAFGYDNANGCYRLSKTNSIQPTTGAIS